MQLSISNHAQVTVFHIAGKVDSTSYTVVIEKAQQAYDEGARHLLLDLSEVSYISSAGLMALHTVARIFNGQSVKLKDGNRPDFRALNPKQDAPARAHVKLMGVQPAVTQVLDVVGLSQFFDVFADLETALQSFSAPTA